MKTDNIDLTFLLTCWNWDVIENIPEEYLRHVGIHSHNYSIKLRDLVLGKNEVFDPQYKLLL